MQLPMEFFPLLVFPSPARLHLLYEDGTERVAPYTLEVRPGDYADYRRSETFHWILPVL